LRAVSAAGAGWSSVTTRPASGPLLRWLKRAGSAHLDRSLRGRDVERHDPKTERGVAQVGLVAQDLGRPSVARPPAALPVRRAQSATSRPGSRAGAALATAHRAASLRNGTGRGGRQQGTGRGGRRHGTGRGGRRHGIGSRRARFSWPRLDNGGRRVARKSVSAGECLRSRSGAGDSRRHDLTRARILSDIAPITIGFNVVPSQDRSVWAGFSA
jgi:hypothetical protein